MGDIDTGAVDSLKVLDPKWPIREADIERVRPQVRFGPTRDLALMDNVEDDLLPLDGQDADHHLPGQHRHHAAAGIALGEDQLPRGITLDSRMGEDRIDLLVGKT